MDLHRRSHLRYETHTPVSRGGGGDRRRVSGGATAKRWSAYKRRASRNTRREVQRDTLDHINSID